MLSSSNSRGDGQTDSVLGVRNYGYVPLSLLGNTVTIIGQKKLSKQRARNHSGAPFCLPFVYCIFFFLLMGSSSPTPIPFFFFGLFFFFFFFFFSGLFSSPLFFYDDFNKFQISKLQEKKEKAAAASWQPVRILKRTKNKVYK